LPFSGIVSTRNGVRCHWQSLRSRQNIEHIAAKVFLEYISMLNKPTYEELTQRVIEQEQVNVKVKQVEKSLRENEKKYHDIITHLNEGFYSVTLDGTLLDYNIEFKNILGLDPDFDAKGIKLTDFWQNPVDRNIYIDELTKSDFIKDFEIKTKKSNDEIIVVQANARLIRDKQDNPIRIEGSFFDITDRKNAEKELIESKERFSLAMDAVRHGLWDWKIADDEVYYSPGCSTMLGYTANEISAGGEPWGNLIHIDDKAGAQKATIDCFENRSDEIKIEIRMKAKNEEWRWIEMRGQVVSRNRNNRAIRLVGTNVDITERKRFENELKKNREELEKTVKQRTRELLETNNALKILLRKSEEDRIELEEKVLANVIKLVLPYLKKIKAGQLDDMQINFLTTAESNLNNITSAFSHKLSLEKSFLTPTEIQIANLLKEGKSSKEIAEITSSKTSTIDFHRRNLRKKLGLKSKSINLKSHLRSLQ